MYSLNEWKFQMQLLPCQLLRCQYSGTFRTTLKHGTIWHLATYTGLQFYRSITQMTLLQSFSVFNFPGPTGQGDANGRDLSGDRDRSSYWVATSASRTTGQTGDRQVGRQGEVYDRYYIFSDAAVTLLTSPLFCVSLSQIVCLPHAQYLYSSYTTLPRIRRERSFELPCLKEVSPRREQSALEKLRSIFRHSP